MGLYTWKDLLRALSRCHQASLWVIPVQRFAGSESDCVYLAVFEVPCAEVGVQLALRSQVC